MKFALLIFGALTLAGCNTELAKHEKPIPYSIRAKMERLDIDKGAPVLMRIFKEEAELEVWKKDRSGRFSLIKTYAICAWSGELGPKKFEGDRQAPEGFYTIRPHQMNPNSNFHLAFNLGFPNEFDRAHGRTGSFLMVHGACSSRGCYAMEDDQIEEIYAMGREAFFGGQRAFQVQAYPFRMTGENLARYHDSPHLPFWRMIKQGNDHFEVTGRAPKINVCDRRYVFNAQSNENFIANAACPAYTVPSDILMAVQDKQAKDQIEFDIALEKIKEKDKEKQQDLFIAQQKLESQKNQELAKQSNRQSDQNSITGSIAASLSSYMPFSNKEDRKDVTDQKEQTANEGSIFSKSLKKAFSIFD